MTPEERMDICKECVFFSKTLKICKKCGCLLPLKTKLQRERCPIRKW